MSGSAAPESAPRKGSLRDLLPRLFREKKLGAVGLIIVLVFFLVGVFADVLATHDLRDQNLSAARSKDHRPSFHWAPTNLDATC